MNFKQFLDGNSALKIAVAKCENNLQAIVEGSLPIYRSQLTTDFNKASLSDATFLWKNTYPRTERRRSLSRFNLLMYLSSKWTEFPDRSLSYFGATDIKTLSHFKAEPVIIIPYDNVSNFGIAAEDFNFSEITVSRQPFIDLLLAAKDLYQTRKAGDHHLTELRKRFGLPAAISEIPDEDIPKFIEFIDEVLKNPPAFLTEPVDSMEEALDDIGSPSFSKALEKITPKTWGLSLATRVQDIPSCGEVWFEGGYLAIANARDSVDVSSALLNLLRN